VVRKKIGLAPARFSPRQEKRALSRAAREHLAALYIALGDLDRALTWLAETAPGDIQANWLPLDPAFDPVRSNSRFQTVVNRVDRKANSGQWVRSQPMPCDL